MPPDTANFFPCGERRSGTYVNMVKVGFREGNLCPVMHLESLKRTQNSCRRRQQNDSPHRRNAADQRRLPCFHGNRWFRRLVKDRRPPAGPDIRRYHDAAPGRLRNLFADQAQQGTFKETPVIMLSSRRTDCFDRARGRIVGSEQYLTKPFTKDELLGAISNQMG